MLVSLSQLCHEDKVFRTSFCSNRESCLLVRILSSSSVGGLRKKGIQDGTPKAVDFVNFLEMLLKNNSTCKELSNLIKNILKQLGVAVGGGGKDILKAVKRASPVPTLSPQNLLKMIVCGKVTSGDFSSLFAQLIDGLPSVSYSDLNAAQVVDVGIRIVKEHRSFFEEFLKVLCCSSTSKKDDSFCVNVLVTLLRKLNGDEEIANGEGGNSATGVIVDRLCRVDPEILQLNPVLLRELLFTNFVKEKHLKMKQKATKQQLHKQTKPAESAFTAYLTSVMAHEIRNSTLQDCVQWMFSTTKNFDRFVFWVITNFYFIFILLGCLTKYVTVENLNLYIM